jgi:hypothetical protein
MSIFQSSVQLWLEKFYSDGVWISPEALAKSLSDSMSESEGMASESDSDISSLGSSETDSRTESHDSRSHSDSGSGSNSGSGESDETEDKSVELSLPVFKKRFKVNQLYLWARLRTQPTTKEKLLGSFEDLQSVAMTLQKKKVKGLLDVLQDSQGYLRKYCEWVNCAWITDPFSRSVQSCEFFHECAMGMVINQALADVPVFMRASLHLADLEKKQLQFALVNNGLELDSSVHKLSLEALHSVIFQVLVALCIAQERIRFKHHDLHLGNVMISPRKANGSWIAKTAYGMCTVPLVDYDATLIDFGLSSCKEGDIEISRLDTDLLVIGESGTSSCSHTSDVGKSWGVWDPELDGDTGYDFTMFVENLLEATCAERPLNIQKVTFLAELQKLSQTPCTDRNRPAQKSGLDWTAVLRNFLEVN